MFPLIAPKVAVIVDVPVFTAVTAPLIVTVATPVFEELQVTMSVMSWVVVVAPSE